MSEFVRQMAGCLVVAERSSKRVLVMGPKLARTLMQYHKCEAVQNVSVTRCRHAKRYNNLQQLGKLANYVTMLVTTNTSYIYGLDVTPTLAFLSSSNFAYMQTVSMQIAFF